MVQRCNLGPLADLAKNLFNQVDILNATTRLLFKSLADNIDEYTKARYKLFLNILEREGKSWCTICREVFPKSALTALMLCYTKPEQKLVLHRSCEKCRAALVGLYPDNKELGGILDRCSEKDWLEKCLDATETKFYIRPEIAQALNLPPAISFSPEEFKSIRLCINLIETDVTNFF